MTGILFSFAVRQLLFDAHPKFKRAAMDEQQPWTARPIPEIPIPAPPP
jgi:hypothetical protein